MRTILCYGDSNTWGFNPENKQRYPRQYRWPNSFAEELGDGYEVIAEGQNGRTTVHDDPVEGGHKNGLRYLEPCLESHKPLSLVIVMLGVNDLKARFGVSAEEIARSVRQLVDRIGACGYGPNGGPPQVLLVSPPPVTTLTEFATMFTGAEEKSRGLADAYAAQAADAGCHVADAGAYVSCSPVDGIHLEADAQVALGRALAETVKGLDLDDV